LTWLATRPNLFVEIINGMALTSVGDAFFWISLVGLLVLAAREFLGTRKFGQTIFYVAVLLACGGVYSAFFQSGRQVSLKGDQPHQWAFVVVLYGWMILGMMSNYLFNRFVNPKPNRTPFDVGNFLAPILISPIVFIPLLAAFQNAEVDLSILTPPKLMIFLVAFENGFVWKQIFENRLKEQRS
jgi:hypothetical protein